MTEPRSFRALFRRERKPGDLLFAALFLAFALFLLARLPDQTQWMKRTGFAAQPAFWPGVAIFGMVGFGALHLLSSALSPRMPGRWREALFWARSAEYALWFMAYVFAAPLLGYLPATVLFCLLLAFRAGYRGAGIGWAAASGFGIVLLFKTFLQVKAPAGALYEHLPEAARAFMLTWF